MPRKTKAELAAEKEALGNTEMEAVQQEQESAPLPAEEESSETADTVSLPEEEPQEAAIAGLLADYSTASEEDVGKDAEAEPQGKSPQEENAGEAPDEPAPADNGVEESSAPAPVESSPEEETEEIIPTTSEPEPSTRRRAAREQPAPRPSFFQTNFRELDRDLSPEQMQEWNSIYASYRSKSVLTGTVIGVDDNRFEVTNPQTGLPERRTVRSLVIIGYRIKVLIPESEVWAPGEERPDYVMRGMVGAKIDYVVMQVDREGECAIASRRLALVKQRRHFASLRRGHELGAQLKCNLLVVGPRRVLAECGGYDVSLSQRDLSWTAIADLRNEYRPGQELPCRLKEYNSREGKLSVSVRDATPNPFIGAENRHPIGSRRQAVISGKYAGGVFCRLPDDVTVLCLYSNLLGDNEFFPGDSVLIHITQYDYNRQLIYGRIISKW